MTALEAALPGLDPAQVATVRIGNPLATPLSPHRMMLQLAPDDGEQDAADDDAGRLLDAVAARAAGRPSLLVVVEHAETLTPASLALLQLLPGLRTPGAPFVRVVFHGTAAFRALLDDPRFAPIRDHLPASPVPGRAGTVPVAQSRPSLRRRRLVLGAAFAAAALLGIGHLLYRPHRAATAIPAATNAPVPAPAPPPAPEAAAQPPAAPAAEAPQTLPPPAAIAEDPATARARLFRDFSAFVEARGLAGRLSPTDREALFQEYLARRHVAATTPPSRTTAPAPAAIDDRRAVVVLFPVGVPGAEARAAQDAVLLRNQVQAVTLRSTDRSPPDPRIIYFDPDDRDLAVSLARTLPPAPTEWQVMDMSAAAGHPAKPTIEVWLPRPRPGR